MSPDLKPIARPGQPRNQPDGRILDACTAVNEVVCTELAANSAGRRGARSKGEAGSAGDHREPEGCEPMRDVSSDAISKPNAVRVVVQCCEWQYCDSGLSARSWTRGGSSNGRLAPGPFARQQLIKRHTECACKARCRSGVYRSSKLGALDRGHRQSVRATRQIGECF